MGFGESEGRDVLCLTGHGDLTDEDVIAQIKQTADVDESGWHITSWSVEQPFTVDGLDVLYSHLYVETDRQHQFELWPDGEHPVESAARLRQWVPALEERLAADVRSGTLHRVPESAQ